MVHVLLLPKIGNYSFLMEHAAGCKPITEALLVAKVSIVGKPPEGPNFKTMNVLHQYLHLVVAVVLRLARVLQNLRYHRWSLMLILELIVDGQTTELL